MLDNFGASLFCFLSCLTFVIVVSNFLIHFFRNICLISTLKKTGVYTVPSSPGRQCYIILFLESFAVLNYYKYKLINTLLTHYLVYYIIISISHPTFQLVQFTKKNVRLSDTVDWVFQFSLFNRLYLYHADTLKRKIRKK